MAQAVQLKLLSQMADNVKVRGLVHDRESYKKWSLAKFIEVFGTQVPYRRMQPEAREKALTEDYAALVPQKRTKSEEQDTGM